ncbi:hypothetical protein POUND7_013535, partial [Theobroma cacao]
GGGTDRKDSSQDAVCTCGTCPPPRVLNYGRFVKLQKKYEKKIRKREEPTAVCTCGTCHLETRSNLDVKNDTGHGSTSVSASTSQVSHYLVDSVLPLSSLLLVEKTSFEDHEIDDGKVFELGDGATYEKCDDPLFAVFFSLFQARLVSIVALIEKNQPLYKPDLGFPETRCNLDVKNDVAQGSTSVSASTSQETSRLLQGSSEIEIDNGTASTSASVSGSTETKFNQDVKDVGQGSTSVSATHPQETNWLLLGTTEIEIDNSTGSLETNSSLAHHSLIDVLEGPATIGAFRSRGFRALIPEVTFFTINIMYSWTSTTTRSFSITTSSKIASSPLDPPLYTLPNPLVPYETMADRSDTSLVVRTLSLVALRMVVITSNNEETSLSAKS